MKFKKSKARKTVNLDKVYSEQSLCSFLNTSMNVEFVYLILNGVGALMNPENS